MKTNDIQAYIEDNFRLDGATCRIIRNILDYMEGQNSEERYNFFTIMLDGIGLSDNEIRMFA